jgi:hypothetical protein
MAEVRYLDGLPAIRNSGILTEQRDIQAVWLWDCGPEEPIPPDEPVPPSIPFGDPKFHLENLRHKRAVKRFEDELALYDRNEREFQHWHKNVRGPIEFRMNSTEARDAIKYDKAAVEEGRQKQRRWWLSARTRGAQFEMSAAQFKNLGLPPGVVPGEGHRENLERQLAGEKEFVDILKADPHFGQETRP